MLLRAIFIGFLWFLVESSFLLVMQTLLRAMGLMSGEFGILPSYLPGTVLGASLLMVCYGFFRATVSVMREYYAGATVQVFVRTQRERIVNFSLRNTGALTSYEVMSMFTDSVNRSEHVVLQCTQFVNVATSAVLLFLLGLKIAPTELLVGILMLAIFVGPIDLITRRISQVSSELGSEWLKINKHIQLGFKNSFFLKVHQLIEYEISEVSQALRRFEKIYRRLYLSNGIKGSFPMLIGTLILGVITFVSKTYLKTEGVVLISFFYIFIRISQAASEGNVALANLKINFPAMKQLYSWNLLHGGARPPVVVDDSNAASKFRETELMLEVSGLSFSYPNGESIFKNLDLTLKSGDLFLIKGPSGGGKSTLLSVLVGVLKPGSGQVLLNGQSIDLAPKAYSNLIGYVGAEPYLIPGTVRENLSYGLQSRPGDQDVLKALEDACLAEEIRSLPNLIDEPLNESTQLSTGQRQRLSIARAYLRNPRIIIWDEATANIDETLEKSCIQKLLEKGSNSIIIVVSHRNSFDEFATQRMDLKA